MEVLIAITIGAMVMGILATALSLSSRAWEKAKRPPDTGLQDLLELLSLQIVFMNKSPIQHFEGIMPIFKGNKTELYFATNFSPIGLSMNCPVVAHYYFDETNKTFNYNQITVLAISSQVSNVLDNFLNQQNDALITIRSVSKLSFKYIEKDGASPVEVWENPTILPAKILVEVESAEQGETLTRISYLNLFNLEPSNVPVPAKTDVHNESHESQ